MRLSRSDLIELAGLILIAVAIGALFGAWWGALAGGIELAVYGYFLEDAIPPAGDN